MDVIGGQLCVQLGDDVLENGGCSPPELANKQMRLAKALEIGLGRPGIGVLFVGLVSLAVAVGLGREARGVEDDIAKLLADVAGHLVGARVANVFGHGVGGGLRLVQKGGLLLAVILASTSSRRCRPQELADDGVDNA